MAKNGLPLTTIYNQLIELQIANGDTLPQHLVEVGPNNAQNTSTFSSVMLLEAIDI